MKKILSWFLVVALTLSMCLQTINVNAAENDLKPLPAVGKVISGFKTIEVGNMDLINSKTVLFEHEKTGAKLLYIQNKDINRSFDITFKTPAVDNTGVNHILEHSSVSGSEKYPLKSGIFSLINQTYCTFANAMTSYNYTTYPIASMSEAQLLKLTDVYLNSVYHPLVYSQKNVFSREAWRYEMEDSNAPLKINGTVFNEMKGSLGDISSASYFNVLKTLLPNSVQSNISGGNPDDIKGLTYDQLIKTHETYYHPSNSLMVLYGNLDYEKFLKFINDDYLSKYDKKQITIDKGIVAPFSQMGEKTFKFPVAASTDTKKASEIDYAFALTDLSLEDLLGMSIVVELLNQDTSSLKQEFNDRQIGGNISVSFNSSLAQPVLTFSVQNADESKSAELKELVDNCLSNAVKTGFDKEAADAIISASLLSLSNLSEVGSLGVIMSMSVSSGWASFDNLNYMNDQIKNFKNMSTKVKDNYLEGLVTKYLIDNDHAALVTTVPEAGLAERQESDSQKYLSDVKESMSKEQIEKIVADTKSYNEWIKQESDQNVIKGLQVVKVADLQEEVKKYVINETTASDGVRILSAEANVAETGNTEIKIDTSSVPVEKLHYLKLYTSLLGSLDTNTYTQKELNTKVLRYLGGTGFSISSIKQKDCNEFNPYLSISWVGLMGEYDKQVELVKDILLNTKYEDAEDVLDEVKAQIANIKASLSGEPLYLLMSRNTAQFDYNANYESYMSGIEYFNFLVDLEKELASDPQTVLNELKNINEIVVNRTNMITTFAGNKGYIGKYEEAMKSFADSLQAKTITKQDYTTIPKPALREGLAVDSTVQYNMISATYDKMGTKFNGKYIPVESLINENYTTPKIRFENGAYDNMVNFSSNGLLLASYRDPNIKETFDIYKGLPEFLKNIDITQEDLDRYILKAFSDYSMPKGELVGASSAIDNYLSGETADDNLKVLKEIKSLTVQDVKDLSAVIENFIKNGAYSTAGSMQKLNDNKELYDTIISIAEDKENGSDKAITRKQLIQLIFKGMDNPINIAKQKGLVIGDGEGNYLEDSKLTKEELAVIIDRLTGMSGIQLSGEEVTISDMDGISPWAQNSVKALVGAGIMKLDENGNFNPGEEITTSYVQTILNMLTQKIPAK